MFDITKNSECILNDEENITLKDILETFQEFDDFIRECEEEEMEDCLEDCLEDYLFDEVIPGMEKLIDKFGIEEVKNESSAKIFIEEYRSKKVDDFLNIETN